MQIHSRKRCVGPAILTAGSGPTLTWRGPHPRMASWREAAPSCHISPSERKLRVALEPFQHLPFLFFGGLGADVEETGAPHLTELSHQSPFIRNSAGLLFLLLTASVFFLWIPSFSAHSCFFSAPLFSLLKRCFCKMPIRY